MSSDTSAHCVEVLRLKAHYQFVACRVAIALLTQKCASFPCKYFLVYYDCNIKTSNEKFVLEFGSSAFTVRKQTVYKKYVIKGNTRC